MRRERGFTVIELLVIIAILAVLFGLTALALTSVGTSAENAAQEAELQVVRQAIHAYMATNDTAKITPNSSPTRVGPSSGHPLSEYLLVESQYCYTWASDGTASLTTCP